MQQTNFSSEIRDRDPLQLALLESDENMDRAISRLAASMLREAAIDMARGKKDVKLDAEIWINNGHETQLPFNLCVNKVFPEDVFPKDIVQVVKERMFADPITVEDAMSEYLTNVSNRIITFTRKTFKTKSELELDEDMTVDQENELMSSRP
ncbi:MAG: hypothetical protein Q7K26_01590 [bacterium]|nr:hypothetical protein [bacterium]